MTNGRDTTSAALHFAGSRAHGMALILVEKINSSDIPPDHWDEVIERLRDLLIEVADLRRSKTDLRACHVLRRHDQFSGPTDVE